MSMNWFVKPLSSADSVPEKPLKVSAPSVTDSAVV